MKFLIPCFILALVYGEEPVLRTVPPKNLICIGINEEVSPCGNPCSQGCYNNPNLMCAAVCREGCFCKENYLRNSSGVCIPKEKCTQADLHGCNPETEDFQKCMPACQVTCSNMNLMQGCIDMCKPPGCNCKNGLVRNKNGECILPTSCPKEEIVCPKTMIYRPFCRRGRLNCLDKCGCPWNTILYKESYKCLSKEDYNKVRTQECQSEDPNKEYNTNNAFRTCINGVAESSTISPDLSELYQCVCKIGFYFDKSKNKCVTEIECKENP